MYYRRCLIAKSQNASRDSVDSLGVLFKPPPLSVTYERDDSRGEIVCPTDDVFPFRPRPPSRKIDDPFHIFSYVYISPRAEQSKMKR